MKVTSIGLGRAGTAMLDKLLEYDHEVSGDFIRSPTAISPAPADLERLNHVPRDRRLRVGQDHLGSQPIGTDRALGSRIVRQHAEEMLRVITTDDAESDAVVFLSALDDGFGTPAITALANRLRGRAPGRPVFGLGVLPESAQLGRVKTAIQAIGSVREELDTLFVVDIKHWRDWANGDRSLAVPNDIVRRFGMLWTIDEAEPADIYGSTVRATDDVLASLTDGGIASVGYATSDESPPPSSGTVNRPSGPDIVDLVRIAVTERLTVDCDVGLADRGLLIVGGPESALTERRVDEARNWLQNRGNLDRVEVGVFPFQTSETLVSVVVLSNVQSIPALDNLKATIEDSEISMEATDPPHAAEAHPPRPTIDRPSLGRAQSAPIRRRSRSPQRAAKETDPIAAELTAAKEKTTAVRDHVGPVGTNRSDVEALLEEFASIDEQHRDLSAAIEETLESDWDAAHLEPGFPLRSSETIVEWEQRMQAVADQQDTLERAIHDLDSLE